MNRHIYRLVAAVLAAITIVSCNCARDSEVYKLLQDVKSYIDEKPLLLWLLAHKAVTQFSIF